MNVDDDGSCTYSEEISTSIDDGEYVIQVLAIAIGQSTENPTGNTIFTDHIGWLFYSIHSTVKMYTNYNR